MEELLGNYSISRITLEEYKVTFEIPDNCTYKVTDKDGVYVVAIELTENETEPSENYTNFSFLTRAYEGAIHIEFNQNNGSDVLSSIRKPKVIILVND